MTEQYRKLSDDELKMLGFHKHNAKVANLILGYYPEAAKLICHIESEYDDEYHSNTISSYTVLDTNNDELPLKAKFISKKLTILDSLRNLVSFKSRTDDQLEDIVLSIKTPELYVKVPGV